MPGYEWRTTSELKNPCYDAETKTDCPDRCGGCQLNCPKWKAYLVERDELYKKRSAHNRAEEVIAEAKINRYVKAREKKERLKRMFR